MNANSVICKYIFDHPNDWYESLHKDYGIRIKKEDSLAIFSYNVECDFKNPIVQEARGIIIDYEKIEVVCWPFRKFGNYTESYADKIDWNMMLWLRVTGTQDVAEQSMHLLQTLPRSMLTTLCGMLKMLSMTPQSLLLT